MVRQGEIMGPTSLPASRPYVRYDSRLRAPVVLSTHIDAFLSTLNPYFPVHPQPLLSCQPSIPTLTGSGFKVVNNFDIFNGGFPSQQPVVYGKILYGTTSQAGSSGAGTIYT
jgi:hypothetical protein